MNKLLAMFVLLASAQIAAAPPKPDAVAEPRKLGDEAMKYVAADDMKGLFAFITRYMPMERLELNKQRDSSIEQRRKIPAVLGKSLGFSFIRECRLSDVLVRVDYAEKREKNVIRWQFVFYRPRNAWSMVSFNWDDKVNLLFEPCS